MANRNFAERQSQRGKVITPDRLIRQTLLLNSSVPVPIGVVQESLYLYACTDASNPYPATTHYVEVSEDRQEWYRLYVGQSFTINTPRKLWVRGIAGYSQTAEIFHGAMVSDHSWSKEVENLEIFDYGSAAVTDEALHAGLAGDQSPAVLLTSGVDFTVLRIIDMSVWANNASPYRTSASIDWDSGLSAGTLLYSPEGIVRARTGMYYSLDDIRIAPGRGANAADEVGAWIQYQVLA
jgi:hypothetical protein